MISKISLEHGRRWPCATTIQQNTAQPTSECRTTVPQKAGSNTLARCNIYSGFKLSSGDRRADREKTSGAGGVHAEGAAKRTHESWGIPPQGPVSFLHAEFDDGVAHVRQYKRSQHHPVEKSQPGKHQCKHHPSTQLRTASQRKQRQAQRYWGNKVMANLLEREYWNQNHS